MNIFTTPTVPVFVQRMAIEAVSSARPTVTTISHLTLGRKAL
jgi:hypothetical protein